MASKNKLTANEKEIKTVTVTRKLTLYPYLDEKGLEDLSPEERNKKEKEEINRVYKYLRNGMKLYSSMMNRYLSALYSARINNTPPEEIKELNKRYSRRSDPARPGYSAYDDLNWSLYPTGLPLASSVVNEGKKAFDKSCKDGLLYGKVSLPTLRDTCPIPIPKYFCDIKGKHMVSKEKGIIHQTGLWYKQESLGEFLISLMKDADPGLKLDFANKIKFNVDLGNPRKSMFLRSELAKVFTGVYEVCDSKICIEKKYKSEDNKKKIVLSLSLKIPKHKMELDPETVVGVDLGLANPVVCVLNNNLYEYLYVGSYDQFTHLRVSKQKQRQRIQRSLTYCASGHGEKKKNAHRNRLAMSERYMARTLNHKFSSRIVDFAVKHNAAYINLENLKGFKKEERDNFVLRNWSYYELQEMIVYKAKAYGIEVRFVHAEQTSQICSVCGKVGEYDIQKSRSDFNCLNPDCKCNNMYSGRIRPRTNVLEADFNAARIIAMSEDFVKRTEEITEAKRRTPEETAELLQITDGVADFNTRLKKELDTKAQKVLKTQDPDEITEPEME